MVCFLLVSKLCHPFAAPFLSSVLWLRMTNFRVSFSGKGSLGQARREVMTFAQTWFLGPLLPIFC